MTAAKAHPIFKSSSSIFVSQAIDSKEHESVSDRSLFLTKPRELHQLARILLIRCSGLPSMAKLCWSFAFRQAGARRLRSLGKALGKIAISLRNLQA